MPEYLSKRFGGRRLRIYYAIVSLALSILSGISVSYVFFLYKFKKGNLKGTTIKLALLYIRQKYMQVLYL